MKLPTLYKRAASGAVQSWTIETIAKKDGTAEIITTYGQHKGTMQQAVVKVSKGKNVGKANETTPKQQAEAEAKAKHQKQQDKGYVVSLKSDTLDEAVAKRPMLAGDFKKRVKQTGLNKIVWPAYVQPKLDGMRCIAHRTAEGVRLFSRGGKPIETVPHIQEALLPLMAEGHIWDGELYVHGWSFQRLISACKKAGPDTPHVQYHVYDAISDGLFDERFAVVQDALMQPATCGPGPLAGPGVAGEPASAMNVPVVLAVLTRLVASEEEVKEHHDQFVREGYEGAIVRVNGCPYREGARSSCLLKYKVFAEQEYPIVAVHEGKGKMEGSAILECETPEGARFLCVPEGTMAERQDYWDRREELVRDRCLLTVRFFELTTSDPPVPRFPIGKGIRLPEDL